MLQSDFVIAGGGVAGLTVARELLRAGASVTLIEAGTVAGGTSRMAAGMLAPLVEARLAERDLLRLGSAALAFWEGYAEEISAASGVDIGYRTEGTLIVGIEPDHQRTIEHVAEEYRALDLPIEPVGYHECRELEPMLSPTVTGGLYAPLDRQVDNRALLGALVQVIEREPGGRIIEGTRVTDVAWDRQGGLRIGTDREEFRAGGIILTPGAELRRVQGLPGYIERIVRPVKGEILRLAQPQGPLLRHVVRTPEVYLVPKADGTLVVGASSEERGFEREVRVGPLFELLRSAWETLPGVYELPIIEQGVGFRPATLDHAPIIGPVGPGPIWVVGGFYRHGILFAPLVARCFADYLMNQNTRRDDGYERESDSDLPESLRDFDPRRFDTGRL